MMRATCRALLGVLLLLLHCSQSLRHKTACAVQRGLSSLQIDVSRGPSPSASSRGGGPAAGKITSPTPPLQLSPPSSSSSPSGDIFIGDAAFLSEIKQCKKINAHRKIIKTLAAYNATNQLSTNMTAYAFRTLKQMNKTADILEELYPLWQSTAGESSSYDYSNFNASLLLIKGYCRLGRMDYVEAIAASAGVRLDSVAPESSSMDNPGRSRLLVDATALVLPEMAMGYSMVNQTLKAIASLKRMEKLELQIGSDASKAVLKTVIKNNANNVLYIRIAIKALLRLNGLQDNDSIQLLTSAFMRSVLFVKGAVSMATLPPASPYCPEVAFIGRSNVGKSSLINMVSNRKGLAFTSKTPGKTSEFNYFLARGSAHTAHRKDGPPPLFVGHSANAVVEKSQFYLVDLPGVGYAEATREQRSGWISLLDSYVKSRETLRAVFHLVDSRHGLLDADEQCLGLLDSLPEHVNYIIVLTKADKQRAGGAVRKDIVNRIVREIEKRGSRKVPIILSSSESRQGGAAIWSNILDCVAGESAELLLDNRGDIFANNVLENSDSEN